METTASTLSRKAQIDQTATALFRTRGFAATSMRELATALGIEAGSIYSHIRSKEEILHRICFRMADQFFAGFANATQDDTQPAAVRLRRAIESHVRVLTLDVAASAVFLHEWRHLSEAARNEFLTLRERYEVNFRRLIQQGIEAGELHAPDAAFAALTLLASLNWLPNWFKPDGKLTPDDIAHRLADQLLLGLAHS
ncbi:MULTISPECIES: TetR/AcrR family transcriptional regulator [Hymenobacter]|uniref:TetR/AcrR family transcriptional regulator n=1 Tax=Hymenobacter jejuensis TaxID=2502781 RepID=A0A5B8A1Y9_9BACT|nr:MULTISPECIES: TetR/AcrR family transcriptional regulator [Hymenobacter]MBC6989379.1 TetR/AcrR family transcriptional regulator [Hymenobacter sp. BT491]QDA61411.1 TetR/AcrR family transcriptional regulator [Hymenobacter jejuensis]